jgi:hypothetical protein
MAGTLHIFARSVVNGATHYQVNYNLPGTTFAKVFEDEAELRDFLTAVAEMTPSDLDQLWSELNTRHTATIAEVEIPEHETPILGLKQAPTDY